MCDYCSPFILHSYLMSYVWILDLRLNSDSYVWIWGLRLNCEPYVWIQGLCLNSEPYVWIRGLRLNSELVSEFGCGWQCVPLVGQISWPVLADYYRTLENLCWTIGIGATTTTVNSDEINFVNYSRIATTAWFLDANFHRWFCSVIV